jgi:hypothetical protein
MTLDEERATRQEMTDYIRSMGEEGASWEEILGHLNQLSAHWEHRIHREMIAPWLSDMRDAGLIVPSPLPGRNNDSSTSWAMVTGEKHERAAEALRAAIERWDYEFTAAASQQAHPAIRDLFAAIATRTVMTFTPREFSSFCDELLAHRLVLHEVTRVPHFEPETVL